MILAELIASVPLSEADHTPPAIALVVTLLVIATWYDLRARTIPDCIAIGIAAVGIIGNGLTHPANSASGLLLSVTGLAAGSVAGMVLFGLAGFGGGDAKLIAGLGAVLGPVALLQTLFWMALAGAVLALIASMRGKRDLAYAPAIAIGLVVHSVLPDGFWKSIYS